jgi:two-component system response regulator FixJ
LPNSHQTTVIVIDDDVFVCRALKTQLEILGFCALVFHSAEELLANRPSTINTCLLCDVYLPGMSGIELLLHLIDAGMPIPTILMTARDDDRTMRLIRHAKPAAYLIKPFDQAALLRAIQKASEP